jgi:cell division protein FtsQ
MSRWRRKSKGAESGSGGADAEREFTDVKVVKREPAPSEAGAADESERDETDDGVLAELSMAFGDDDTKPIAAPDAALTTIALGGDDDLPDAVYLDEELGGGDDSEPVFIDDDGTGDALLARDATGPGIEPRLRQRRIGVRRAEGRRRLRRWGVVAAVLVVVIAALAVLGSSLFSVDDVDVTGVQRADADAVLAVVDDLVGEPVLLVDTEAAEDRLEQIPYVDTARVRTDFPNGVTVEVREREPVATASGADGRFRILDHEGRVVDVIDGQPIAFVLVSGPTTLDLEAGQYADTGYAAAAAMVTKLTPEVRSRMISMSVVPDGTDLRFLLSNEPGLDIEVRLGAAITDNDQIERLVRLQRVLDDVAGSDTTVIDVSTAETTER